MSSTLVINNLQSLTMFKSYEGKGFYCLIFMSPYDQAPLSVLNTLTRHIVTFAAEIVSSSIIWKRNLIIKA